MKKAFGLIEYLTIVILLSILLYAIKKNISIHELLILSVLGVSILYVIAFCITAILIGFFVFIIEGGMIAQKFSISLLIIAIGALILKVFSPEYFTQTEAIFLTGYKILGYSLIGMGFVLAITTISFYSFRKND